MPRFRVKTTAQVERTYVVEAADDVQAKKRMTAFKHDPDVFAPGIIEEQKDQQRDTSLQQIKECAALPPEKPSVPPKTSGGVGVKPPAEKPKVS